MMPVFMAPEAFWALLGLLAFLAVYCFRRRSKDLMLSSLMFLSVKKIPAEGGAKFTTLQTPLVLLVEVIIVILLITAAAMPSVVAPDKEILLCLILDDSASMSAETGDDGLSARARALKYLKRNIFSENHFCINIIKAGEKPELIGNNDMTPGEAVLFMKEWKCESPYADITEALSLAGEVCGKNSFKMIITDSSMPVEPSNGGNENSLAYDPELKGKMQWLSFGKPASNVAITIANRYSLSSHDRLFLQFTNFSESHITVNAETYFMRTDREGKPVKESIEQIPLDLAPGAVYKKIMNIMDQTATVTAEVYADDFKKDNKICLGPVKRDKLRVKILSDDTSFNELCNITFKALDNCQIVSEMPELIVTDSESAASESSRLIFKRSDSSSYLTSPVSVDTEHPICEGLPYANVPWAADVNYTAPGHVLLSSDNLGLLFLDTRQDKKIDIRLNMDYKKSQLYSVSLWPVLFWNIADYCLYTLRPAENLNSCLGDESCLMKLDSGPLPKEILKNGFTDSFVNIKWLFLILALLLLALHLWMITAWRPNIVY